MAVNEEHREYFCAACGDSVTENDFEAGKAMRRKKKVYCRKCFRKTFPDECEMHPGVKVSVQCSVCMRLYCQNCVIEIAGKQICSRCKDWALDKLADGEELTPDSSLFPDYEEAREKRLHNTFKKAREAGVGTGKTETVRDRVMFRRWDPFIVFFLGVVFLGAVGGYFSVSSANQGIAALFVVTALILLMLFILLTVPKLIAAGSLRTVQVDDWGVSGATSSGAKRQMPWEEITHVETWRPYSSPSSGSTGGVIKVRSGRRCIVIKDHFPRFIFIADVIRDACKEKGIRYEEHAV